MSDVRTSATPTAAPAARPARTAPLLAAIRRVFEERTAPELVALAAVAATPVALFLDYRVHTDLVSWSVIYVPVGENAGRPASYEQIFGLTQVVWLAAAVALLVLRGWRRFVDNVQLLLLVLALAILVAVTAAYEHVDSMTALTLGATMVSYIAMVGVIRHVDVRLPATRDLVTIACVAGAAIIALTAAKAAVHGALSARLGAFAFGPAPETAVVLAPLLVLVPAMRQRRWIKIATALCLAGGLVLTQSRGAFIAALAGAVVLVVAQKGRRVQIAAFVGIVAAAVAYAALSRRSSSFNDAATTYRRENLHYHWHAFLDRPLFGHGLSNDSINAVRAAHNTLLSIADAGGVLLLAVWIAAWLAVPALAFLDRRRRYVTAFVGLAAVTAVVVGWNTTGSEVLLYDPPTNLLPLMLGVALVGPLTLESVTTRTPARVRRQRETVAGVAVAVLVAATSLVVLLSSTNAIGGAGTTNAMSTGLRARALVASESMALSSCGKCRVVSLREVTPNLAEARFDIRTGGMPSKCIFIAPGNFHPAEPGQLPSGVSWEHCGAPALDASVSPSSWLAPSTVTGSTRREARLQLAHWVGGHCTADCSLKSLEPLTSTVWKVRARAIPASRSLCFYAIFSEQPRSSTTAVFEPAFFSCAH